MAENWGFEVNGLKDWHQKWSDVYLPRQCQWQLPIYEATCVITQLGVGSSYRVFKTTSAVQIFDHYLEIINQRIANSYWYSANFRPMFSKYLTNIQQFFCHHRSANNWPVVGKSEPDSLFSNFCTNIQQTWMPELCCETFVKLPHQRWQVLKSSQENN